MKCHLLFQPKCISGELAFVVLEKVECQSSENTFRLEEKVASSCIPLSGRMVTQGIAFAENGAKEWYESRSIFLKD